MPDRERLEDKRNADVPDKMTSSEDHKQAHEFTSAGSKPAVAAGAVDQAPTASQQAYDEEQSRREVPFMDDTEAEDAKRWNDNHPEEVAAFNKATDKACCVHGKLDVRKVWMWQENHDIVADGCVDARTVALAEELVQAGKPKQDDPVMTSDTPAAPSGPSIV